MGWGPSSPIDSPPTHGGSGWSWVFALRAAVPVSLGEVICGCLGSQQHCQPWIPAAVPGTAAWSPAGFLAGVGWEGCRLPPGCAGKVQALLHVC